MRCGRVRDFTAPEAEHGEWRILPITGHVMCSNCLTADDVVAARYADFWFDENGITRIACRCGADLGLVPEMKPTDVECLSCHAVWTVTGEVGHTLKAKQLPPLT